MSLKALSLPEDILRIIIESSDKFTLCKLLLVSKQIHAFAEPIFYRDVYLDVSGFPSNLSLFHTRMTSDSLPSTTVGNQGYSDLIQSRRQQSLSLCVKSFSVEFAAGHDWEDIQLLDSLLPTLLNLESFSLHFHYYDAQIGRFKFLQDAPLEASTSSNMNLRKFSFTSENHEGAIDITPFLCSHPNLEYIQLYTDMLYVDPGDQHQLSFPNLKAYGGYLSPRTLSQSAAALTYARLPLETEGVPEMPALSTLSIDSRQEYTFAPLKVILSRARNVKNLEIFDFDARWDFWEGLNEVLDGSNIKHIRIMDYWAALSCKGRQRGAGMSPTMANLQFPPDQQAHDGIKVERMPW
ncbi:hypothetical protein ONZ45_g7225 [Pleurotus djamor]|nr:hypothetical protein ONZ45_g7225 [Pleurotus djamor]